MNSQIRGGKFYYFFYLDEAPCSLPKTDILLLVDATELKHPIASYVGSLVCTPAAEIRIGSQFFYWTFYFPLYSNGSGNTPKSKTEAHKISRWVTTKLESIEVKSHHCTPQEK